MTTIGPKNLPDLPELPTGPKRKITHREPLSVAGFHRREKEAKIEVPKNHIPAPTEQELHQAEPPHVKKGSLLEKGKKYMTSLKEILGKKEKKEVSAVQLQPIAQKTHSDADRHHAMNNLISHLDGRGYAEEGLLRKSGNANTVKDLQSKSYESSGKIPNDVEIYAATDALKAIWREVSFDKAVVGQEFEDVGSSGKPDLEQLKEKTKEEKVFTKEQKQILDSMLGYAVKVAENVGENKMDASNIAKILAPALGDFAKWGAVEDVLIAIIDHNIKNPATPFKFSE